MTGNAVIGPGQGGDAFRWTLLFFLMEDLICIGLFNFELENCDKNLEITLTLQDFSSTGVPSYKVMVMGLDSSVTCELDWIYLINTDMIKFDISLSDESISILTKQEFKKIVKSKMRKSVYTVLESIKQGHSTVRDIQHYGLKYPQPFLTSALFNK